MEKLPLCRICLRDNVRMYIVISKDLHALYKRLTDVPFVTKDRRPMLACFICCTKLKQCYWLLRKCQESEEHLTKMMDEDYESKSGVKQECLDFFYKLTISPAVKIDIVDFDKPHTIAIKEEIPYVYETLDDIIKPKEEPQNSEVKPENVDNSYQEFEDLPPNQSESDSEDNVPILEFKSEAEVSTEKRTATETKWAPVAKEPKLGDTVTAEQKETETIKNCQNHTSKPITEFKDPVNNTPGKPGVSNSINKTAIDKNFCNNSNKNNLKGKTKFKIPTRDSDDVNIDTLSNQDVLKCGKCGSGFKRRCDLNKHIRAHSRKNNHKCEICHRIYKHKYNLKRHSLVHTSEKPYKCSVCQRIFKFKNSFEIHVRKHSVENPYICDYCQRGFRLKYVLIAHIRKHTGEKPFKCEICKQCFTRRNGLNEHIRIHTGEKPHKCELCQRSFRDKGAYARHTFIHTGKKPNKCEKCPQSFSLKSDLIKHNRIHTGEKPYKCGICQRSFNRKSILTEHYRIHTGEKPFKCEICQHGFRLKGVLTRHIRTHNT